MQGRIQRGCLLNQQTIPNLLEYQPTRMQIHRDADGAVQIVIPPPGWMKALGVKSGAALVFMVFFAILGLAGPPAAIFLLMHGPERFALLVACPIFECAVLGIALAAVASKAKQSCLIRATPRELRIEVFGWGDPMRLVVSREEIETLTARIEPPNSQFSALTLYVRRKGFDTADVFLESLPEAQIREIARVLRQELGFGAGEREGK